MPPLNVPMGGDVFAFEGESHLMTIASADSGKVRSVIIPNLLTYVGPVVVVDPNGESYSATADTRRAMGHTVLRLDPFHVVDENSDAINPLDLFSRSGSEIEKDCRTVADLLYPGGSFLDVWENLSFNLLVAVLGYIASVPDKRAFSDLTKTLSSDDVVYELAVVLDTIGKKIPPTAYKGIASFLAEPDNDRSRILRGITSRLAPLMDTEIQKTLDHSSVPLADLSEGKPISIYAIIPPLLLHRYRLLIRLWIGTVLQCIGRRRSPPAHRTLLILDECGQLDTFPLLEEAITLLGGYGLHVWTFWQDISQLRSVYPSGWQTMISNCGAVQIYGAKDYSTSAEVAALFGLEQDDVRLLGADEQIVCLDGTCSKIKKIDYFVDRLFSGQFTAKQPNEPREEA